MTTKELNEKFDELMKDHKFTVPESWNDDITFKQSQIIYRAMLEKEKESLTFKDIDDAYLEGGMFARRLSTKKYEKLIGFIDLLNHSVLEPNQHEILDKILEHTGISFEELRRIGMVYSPEELIKKD